MDPTELGGKEGSWPNRRRAQPSSASAAHRRSPPEPSAAATLAAALDLRPSSLCGRPPILRRVPAWGRRRRGGAPAAPSSAWHAGSLRPLTAQLRAVFRHGDGQGGSSASLSAI